MEWLLGVLSSGNVPIFFSCCLLVHRIQDLIVFKINFCRQFLLVFSPSRPCCGCLLRVKWTVVYPRSVVLAQSIYILNIYIMGLLDPNPNIWHGTQSGRSPFMLGSWILP